MTYITPVKPERQTGGEFCGSRWYLILKAMTNRQGCWELLIFSWSENLAYFSPSNQR